MTEEWGKLKLEWAVESAILLMEAELCVKQNIITEEFKAQVQKARAAKSARDGYKKGGE